MAAAVAAAGLAPLSAVALHGPREQPRTINFSPSQNVSTSPQRSRRRVAMDKRDALKRRNRLCAKGRRP